MKSPLACLLAAFVATAAFAQTAPKPPELRLGDAATPTSYEIDIAVDPREPRFTGEVRIALRVNRAAPVLWMNGEKLDIASATFRIGDRDVAARVIPAAEDFVGFEVEGGFPQGETVATLKWSAALEPVSTRGFFRQQEAGEWYAITQFEAIGARLAFPGFDEPGWKTPFRLTLDVPAADRAISNTATQSVGDAPGRPGWKRHVFARTDPLPTYLLAFAVGPYDLVDGGKAGLKGTPLRYAVPKGRGEQTAWIRQSTPKLLSLLEDYFGAPFPYPKLDSVVIPATVGFGAMENPGMITYNGNLMLAAGARDTLEFRRRYAGVGSHEIAHQWFGDLVTLAWWDDIWLNESFATWMARKNVRNFEPGAPLGWNTGAQRRRALEADRLVSARRVANPVRTKGDLYGAFDGIVYAKGGEVLSMFEAWLGEDRFRAGVRKYLADHAHGNATATDFFRALGDASGRGEAAVAAFRTFIEQPGIPMVETRLACAGGKATLEVDQHRLIAKGAQGPDGRWTTPACFRYGVAGKTYKQCAEIGGRQSIALTEAKQCPGWVVGNADGAGHWVARLDAPLRAKLARAAAKLPVREAVAVVFDLNLLLDTGLIPVDEAWKLAEAFAAHPNVGVRHGVLELMAEQRPEWLRGAAKDRFERLNRGFVQKLAREVGWDEKPGETLDLQELRAVLLPLAARLPGGEPLREEAKARAVRWLEQRGALPGSVVTPVLSTAARFADEGTFTRLERALAESRDRQDRSQLISALALVREPRLLERVFALASPTAGAGAALDAREVDMFLEKALPDDHNRVPAFAFMRKAWEPLRAKLPPDTAWRLVRSLRGLCTPAEREAFVGFFGERHQAIDGGARAYAQTLEAIDTCIAAR